MRTGVNERDRWCLGGLCCVQGSAVPFAMAFAGPEIAVSGVDYLSQHYFFTYSRSGLDLGTFQILAAIGPSAPSLLHSEVPTRRHSLFSGAQCTIG